MGRFSTTVSPPLEGMVIDLRFNVPYGRSAARRDIHEHRLDHTSRLVTVMGMETGNGARHEHFHSSHTDREPLPAVLHSGGFPGAAAIRPGDVRPCGLVLVGREVGSALIHRSSPLFG